MDARLETALHFAGLGGDISSLKNPARQESSRADQLQKMLAAVVLEAGGSVTVSRSTVDKVGRVCLSFSHDLEIEAVVFTAKEL